jgi:hypothetical protein
LDEFDRLDFQLVSQKAEHCPDPVHRFLPGNKPGTAAAIFPAGCCRVNSFPVKKLTLTAFHQIMFERLRRSLKKRRNI